MQQQHDNASRQSQKFISHQSMQASTESRYTLVATRSKLRSRVSRPNTKAQSAGLHRREQVLDVQLCQPGHECQRRNAVSRQADVDEHKGLQPTACRQQHQAALQRRAVDRTWVLHTSICMQLAKGGCRDSAPLACVPRAVNSNLQHSNSTPMLTYCALKSFSPSTSRGRHCGWHGGAAAEISEVRRG